MPGPPARPLDRLAGFRGQALAETGSEEVAVVDLRDALVRLLDRPPPRHSGR